MKTDLRIFKSFFVIVWILIIVFLTCFNVDAQDICKNRYGAGKLVYAGLKQNNTVFYITGHYVERGIGLRVERNFNKDFAAYGAFSYGNYWSMGMFGTVPHQKYTIGFVYCNNELPLLQPRLSVGISYHNMNADQWYQDNPKHVHDWYYHTPDKSGSISDEWGVGMVVANRVGVLFSYSIARHEGYAGLGAAFKF